jgi:HlyD family secretion protein
MKGSVPFLRRPWVLVILAIAVAAGGFLGYRAYRSRTASSSTNLQTVRARVGTLSAQVGATGTVRAVQSAALSFQAQGTVGDVSVQPGDKVAKGDVLAQLDPTSLPAQIGQAQASLVSAQDALDQLLHSNIARTQAQQALANAQAALSHAKYVQWVNQEGNRADVATLNAAEANVALAQVAVDQAQASYNSATVQLHGAPSGSAQQSAAEDAQTSAQGRLSTAQQRLANARATLNWYLGKPTPIDQAIMDANVAVAQAALEDAQRAYERVKDGPNRDDVAAAEANVAAAQAILNQGKIIAPFPGTVTAVDVHPGDQVAPGAAAIEIANLSKYLVDLQVSEVDIDNVKVGQPVTLTFDAITNKTYHGKVTEVGMTGTVASGVVDFVVTADISDPEASIRAGMTAAVNITVSQIDGALLVPSRAVRSQNNQQVVYVLLNGKPTAVPVRLGGSSDTLSQIVGGNVKEGDPIVVNPPTNVFAGGFGGGFGG